MYRPVLLLLPLFAWGAGVTEYRVESGGYSWTVHGWAPEGDEAKPLVLVLHGAGGGGLAYLEKNGWLAEARKSGFIVLAPDGLPARMGEPANFLTNPRVWNGGNVRAGSPRTRVDDVAFIGALLDDAERRWQVAPARIYLVGHSNGGALAFLLAVRLGTRIAAIAPVAALPAVDVQKLRPPVPTVYFLGRLDPLIPLNGGRSVLPWGTRQTEPVEPAISKWSQALGCGAKAESTTLEMGVERRKYRRLLEVVFIEGQGHGWPGGRENGLGEHLVGPSVRTVDATAEIWQFFSRH
jgi:polyhydroxybutyrate depolymerase